MREATSAVESRYPGYWGEISAADVAEAISLAGKTIAWAETMIRMRTG